ncbi:MAG TPA: EcsC family protein [Verrucomicrobiae bacterium]|jgi:hypothetical protein|nr:EcsC family protein [Verrucomicrobiae bacterium]
MDRPPVIFSARDLADLRQARALLENPSYTVRLSNLIGSPIEKALTLLPKGWNAKVNDIAKAALYGALDLAIASTRPRRLHTPASNRWHKILVGASGGIGGAFGLAALAVELPVSTTIMLRSIVEIARSEGHDPTAVATKLDCLEVFAFNGVNRTSNPNETAYWVTRLALSQSVTDAAAYLAGKSAIEKTAPAVTRLVAAIASRFGVIVSEEAAAKAMPVLGAVGGSVANVIFMDHFQQMARGHFIVRRLEKKYGQEAVRERYEAAGA